MSEDIDYAARVQRGIALMDEKWPTWAQDIDLEELDIYSSYHCATAQYAEHMGEESYFKDGQALLGLTNAEYIRHGFNARTDENGETVMEDYESLTALWKAEIIRRREAAQPEASEK